MARRQLAHRLEERTGRRGQPDARQRRRHRGFVQRVGDERRGQDGLDRAGEGETLGGRRVIEGARPDVIAGAKQGARPRVPHGEGVVAEQVVGTFRSPPQIGPQDEVAVGEGGTFSLGNAERGAERLPVVEPGIRGARESRSHVEPQRLPISHARPASEAETDALSRPFPAFRSVVVQPDQHRGQGRVHVAAREDSADRVHAPILPSARMTGRFRSRSGDVGRRFLGPIRPSLVVSAKAEIRGERASSVTNIDVISSLSIR